eukprot:gene30833-38112_t
MQELFRMEADAQTVILTDGLLAMERHGGDANAVEPMMRAAHSIKGAAAIVGLDVVVQLAHGMEDAFIVAQHGKLKLTPNRVDVLLAGVDLILQVSRLNDNSVAPWLAANGAQIKKTMDSIAGIAFLPEPVSSFVSAPISAPAPTARPTAAPPPPDIAALLADMADAETQAGAYGAGASGAAADLTAAPAAAPLEAEEPAASSKPPGSLRKSSTKPFRLGSCL